MPNPDPKYQRAMKKRLEALLSAGVLKIITNEHACGAGKHPSFEGFDHAACAAYQYPRTNPLHFVIHDVVRFEDRPKGRVRAHSAEGDRCEGYPSTLVNRLQEAVRAQDKG